MATLLSAAATGSGIVGSSDVPGRPFSARPRRPKFDLRRGQSRCSIGTQSIEMVIEKLPHPNACIARCVAVVFHPVTKEHPAGLKVGVIEAMVSGRIDDLLDRRSL